MDLGGLGNMMGAVPGGFQQGTMANNQIDQQQIQLVNERAKQVGTAAYFRALQTMMGPQGGQGPQPPNPGQPSMSASAMPGPQMAPPMAMNNGQPVQGADGGIMPAMQSQPVSGATAPGSPPGAVPPPGTAPGGPSGGQQLSWQGIIQSLKASNPNASDLELAHAVDHFMPMMTMQNRLEWQQLKNELMYDMAGLRADTSRANTQDRVGAQVRGQDVRAGTTDRRTDVIAGQEEGRQGRFETAEDRRERGLKQRDDQFKQREDRLERSLQLRSDQGWQRLEQQKQQAQQRIAQGDRRQAVIDWRAAVDAQHKMAMEKIQATNIGSGMKPADREKLLKDQNEWYRGEIEKLKNMSTQRGNITDEKEIPDTQTTVDLPRVQAPPVTPTTPPAASAAPAGSATGQPLPPAFKGDPDGTKYQKGGKTWIKQGDQLVIENGG